jgi:hypothetical protein
MLPLKSDLNYRNKTDNIITIYAGLIYLIQKNFEDYLLKI